MKKLFFAAAILATTCTSAQPVFNTSNDINNYSATDKVDRNKDMSIVPDRKSGESLIRFKSQKAATATITVLDEAGKVLLKQTNQLTTGVNNLPIVNSMKLNEGFYTVNLVTNNQTYSSRFLIWK